jgi:mono/diheme cytochrome c family protein
MTARAPINRPPRRWWHWLAAAVLAFALLAALVAWLNVRGESPLDEAVTPPAAADAAMIQRGAYLARAGNCIGCHTTPGGAALAGGRGIETPFGTVFASNLTPDDATGLGRWSAAEFWRALHHGRSKDGRLLYPAFPYPSFTHVTREDADALYAYLRGVPAVRQPNRPHALRFPYSTQAALAVWRALYFSPGGLKPEPGQPAQWQRGRYLVQGLGHCAACHSGRNALGGVGWNAEFAGGAMPGDGWYAPSLASPAEAGVQGWPHDDVARLLRSGVSARGTVSGPMAEVVDASTQHLSPQDADAMAQYLVALPERHGGPVAGTRARPEALALGAELYKQHCVACHGEQGQGVPGIYPPLAGNRAVTLAQPHNLVQAIRKGGFAPATAGNPRPFGMPPFGHLLSDDEVAALATFLRQSWGHQAPPVSGPEVRRIR